MLKPEPFSAEEPKDEPEMLHAPSPSFEELMMLVFSGPLRESPDDAEEEAEMAAEEEESDDSPSA